MSVPSQTTSPSGRKGIDPRSPRFGAGITAVLLLVTIFLAILGGGAWVAAVVLLAAIAVLFAWGAFAGVQRHPYGRIYKALIRPRLSAPNELEDPVPPTFAQGVGLVITGLGVIIGLFVPVVIVIAAILAFIAAFLNSVFGYCLGCQMYLLGVRLGVFGRGRPAATA